jgi:hypothetical protein
MKPKPLVLLNHFTVPEFITIAFQWSLVPGEDSLGLIDFERRSDGAIWLFDKGHKQ